MRVLGGLNAEKQDFEGASAGSSPVYPNARIFPTSYSFDDPIEDVTIRRCRFAMFQHPVQRDLTSRPTLRRLTVERCHFTASELGPITLEDSTIDTVWFHRGKWGPQRLKGCAFKHVAIRGAVRGSIAFERSHEWSRRHSTESAATDPTVIANEQYYADVDWALDISQAEFTGVEMSRSGIPARLVRRDPETQVMITRTSVTGADWRAACGTSSQWVAIERFLQTGFADAVLIAPRRSKYLDEDVAAFGRLRDIGVVVG